MRTLEVIAVEAGLLDKRDNVYNKIKLSTPNFINQGGQKLRIEPKVQNVTKYPKSYLPDNRPEFAHDAKLGEFIAGDIVTQGGLLPYPITDPKGVVTRMATSATHVVIGNTDDTDAFAELTRREFEGRGKFKADAPGADEKYFTYWGYAAETIETGEVAATETVEESAEEEGVKVEQVL